MIDLYTWTTPNGYKPLIALEELELPYRLHPVNIGEGEQRAPGYLRINPNGKIPALVDGEGTDERIVIFESGAILIYLAEKAGRLLPARGQARADTLAWLMFQMGGVGPMFGQLGHFQRAEEKIPYAIDRYRNEVKRLYGVLDRRLGEVEYLAGDYSIADVATWPWARNIDFFGLSWDPYPNVKRWVDAIGARPAVQRAIATKMTPSAA